jgi:hypothetical protein
MGKTVDHVLVSAHQINAQCKKVGWRNWVQELIELKGVFIRPAWEQSKGEVPAMVSMGKWTVRCPGKTCFGEILINEGESLHFCVACMNIENDFLPQQIVFPNVKQLNELLAARPDYRSRNFEPGETTQDIINQNRMMGWE